MGSTRFSSPVERVRGSELLCTKCTGFFPVERFSVEKRNRSTGRSSWCKNCLSSWRVANRDWLLESKRLDYASNRESRLATNLAAQRRNKDASNARSANWRAANPERRKQVANAWVSRNRPYGAARVSARYAAKRNATPKWVDQTAIYLIYEKAHHWGMEVDHIVPLNSPIVCGLHCEANLQLLMKVENIRKGNRIWPDMP